MWTRTWQAGPTCSLACPMESSKRSTSTSRRYRSAAIHRARQATSLVILAVTLGLPSRSPPIQDPKVMGRACIGRSRPVCFFSAALTLRRYVGTAAHRDCSTMCKPPRASAQRSTAPRPFQCQQCQQGGLWLVRQTKQCSPSTGDGFLRRSSSVCHRAVISRTMSATTISRSSRVRSALAPSTGVAVRQIGPCGSEGLWMHAREPVEANTHTGQQTSRHAR